MSRGHLIGTFVDRDAEHSFPIRLRRAWNGALKSEERDSGAVVGQPYEVRSLGDDPDASENLPLAGDQQDPCIAAYLLPRQGDRHPREYNCVV